MRSFIRTVSDWVILVGGGERRGKFLSELPVSLELPVKSFPDVPQNKVSFHLYWGSVLLGTVMLCKAKHGTDFFLLIVTLVEKI